MDKNVETSLNDTVPCTHSSMTDETVFHAVYIPPDCNGETGGNVEGNIRVYQDKMEALKIIKEFKTGRLKTFKNRADAEEYARSGFEEINCVNNTSVSSAMPATKEKNNFKSLRSQDLVCFRKLIESGDLDAVRSTVWENPRYLISSGDTPAILKEGYRYNALHTAVIENKPEMCELILSTVGDTQFIQLLYGEGESRSYLDRAEIMLDLYLNTPDRRLNETPLHFAVKFGYKDVVRVLVSYPQCSKQMRNKFKQTPIEIICSRKGQEDEELKREIRMLLEDQYYVPVLRSEDTTFQPVIGEPFSPTKPLNLNPDPISPRLEVRAFAGPMTKSRALEFRKKWKTPPRLRLPPARRILETETDAPDTSINSITLRLQDTEKGLERVGRNLAEEYQVCWKEYWPFLNDFADFRTHEDLMKLEKYLERKFQDRMLHHIQNSTDNSADNSKDNPTIEKTVLTKSDDIDYLCSELETCSLIQNDDQEESDTEEFFTPPSSPKVLREDSDDEMKIAEEGPIIYLEGSAPTKLDYAVYNAIPSSVNSNTHPNIYRWRHDVQLLMKRDSHRFNNTRFFERTVIE